MEDRAIAASSSSKSICRTTRPPGRTIRSPMSPAGRIPAGARSGWCGLAPRPRVKRWSSASRNDSATAGRPSGQYQLSRYRDFEPQPNVGFQLAPDFGGEWTLGVGDQRHRAVFNGIVDVGYGFQVSGLYFYGSGKRRATTYGGDLRRMGSFSTNRLRPDGTIVPRNNFVGDPLHRVDMRLQRRFAVGGLSDRRHRGGLQPVQPRELRKLHNGRVQSQLRAADRDRGDVDDGAERRVSVALGAVRVPDRVLMERSNQ